MVIFPEEGEKLLGQAERVIGEGEKDNGKRKGERK